MNGLSNSLQVVILVGGLGTRLKPLTETVPKPMVPILNQPFLYYQLGYLKRQNLKNILLLTGYRGQSIQKFFLDGSSLGLKITYSQEDQPLGTGGALLAAKSLLENQFLLVNGDSFLPFDYQEFIGHFLRSDKIGQLSVLSQEYNFTGVKTNVALDEASGLVSVYRKSQQGFPLSYVDAGVAAFEKKIFSFFPQDKKNFSLEEEIYPLLIAKKSLLAYKISERFYDIGTPERLKEFKEYIQHDYLKNAI